MTIAPELTKTKLTFEEYLKYDDGTDNPYELVDGELVPMHPPTGRDALIIRKITRLLEAEFDRLELPWLAFQMFGVRTGWRSSRLPDLCVTTCKGVEELLDVSAVLQGGALLVVEVVSPDSGKTDYRYKATEYAAAGIPEYWIVDHLKNTVTVMQLVEGMYETQTYTGDQVVRSSLLPELVVTAEQILQVSV